jgi:hypothetical protein
MEIIQGKDSFNKMATGILVKLHADYPSYSTFDYSDFGWNPRTPNRQVDLLVDTLDTLKDMGYIKVISATDMDYAAKLTPLGVSVLTQKAPTSGDTIINVLKSAAGETRTAVIGAILSKIFGG